MMIKGYKGDNDIICGSDDRSYSRLACEINYLIKRGVTLCIIICVNIKMSSKISVSDNPSTANKRPCRQVSKAVYVFEEDDDEFESELAHPDEPEDYDTEESDHESESEEEADSEDEAAEIAVQASQAAVSAAQTAFGLAAPVQEFFTGKKRPICLNKAAPDNFHKKAPWNIMRFGRNKIPIV